MGADPVTRVDCNVLHAFEPVAFRPAVSRLGRAGGRRGPVAAAGVASAVLVLVLDIGLPSVMGEPADVRLLAAAAAAVAGVGVVGAAGLSGPSPAIGHGTQCAAATPPPLPK